MRADGSFKSLITGVATVPVSQQGDREYMRQCTNMRNDQIDGLKRRAGVELTSAIVEYSVNGESTPRNLSSFNSATDVIKPFSLGADDYWLIAKGNEVGVVNADGTLCRTYSDTANDSYVNNLSGNDSLRFAVSGDSVYIANQNKEVKMLEDSQPSGEQMSVVSLKFAPTVYSQVIIEWSWPYSADSDRGTYTYEIGQDHPEQPIPAIEDVDTGVNNIAHRIGFHIQQLITQKEIDDGLAPGGLGITTVWSADSSSIGFLVDPVPPVGSAFPAPTTPYAQVTLSDGTGGAFVAVNESVANVIDLPRDFLPDAIVEVKPDPESGAGRYYMKATAKDVGTKPTPMPWPASLIVTNKPSAEQPSGPYKRTGMWFNSEGDREGMLGQSLAAPFIDYPGDNLHSFYADTEVPVDETASTTFVITTRGASGSIIPGDYLQDAQIWYRTGNAGDGPYQHQHIVNIRFYKVNDYNHGGYGYNVWKGTLDTGFEFLESDEINTGIEESFEVYGFWPKAPTEFKWDGTAPPGNSHDDAPEGDFIYTPRMTAVEWTECGHPHQNAQLDARTLPHVLHRLSANTFEYGSWSEVTKKASPQLQARKAGDDITNPPPSFVGTTIRDVAVHQNRLVVLTKDKVSFSVSGQKADWWRGTTSQLLASGPIDIQSTSSAAGDLRSFTTHNNDLMIFGPYGQFRFSGQKALTPQNAALPQAASYPNQSTALPVSAGNSVYFTTTYGESSGLSQFSLDPQIQNLSVALPMASRQIGLMQGEIQQLAASPNLGVVFCRMLEDSRRIYVMEFLPNVDILKQPEPTWADWVYEWGVDIVSMTVVGSRLNFAAADYNGNNVRLYSQPLHNDNSIPFLDCLATDEGVIPQ